MLACLLQILTYGSVCLSWLLIWAPVEWQSLGLVGLFFAGVSHRIASTNAMGVTPPIIPLGNPRYAIMFLRVDNLIIVWKGLNFMGWTLWIITAFTHPSDAILWWYVFQIIKQPILFLAGCNNAKRVKQGQRPIGNYAPDLV